MTTTVTTDTEMKDPETAESTSASFTKGVTGVFSPRQKTSEQKKTSDEGEDEAKIAATEDTVGFHNALTPPKDEPHESSEARSVE